MSDFDGIPKHWGRGHYRDVPICKWARLSRERQVRDLERSLSGDPEFPYYYDDKAADRVVKFFSQLRFYDGEWAGQRFILADWQEWDLIRVLFGWRSRLDGLRRFRRADIIVPKKQGKTPIAAGIGAYMMLADREPGARVLCGATSKTQAREVWDAAMKMILRSPELRGQVVAFKQALFNPILGSSFVPISRSSEAADGPSVHCGIMDEIHAHKDRALLDIVDRALGARRQPLVLNISTLGVIGTSPVWDIVKFIKEVLERRKDNEKQFCYFTTVDDPEKWTDPVEWQKANPNLGISIYPAGFADDIKNAVDMPSKQNLVKCKNLNIPVTAESKWLNMEDWDLCGGTIEPETLKHKPCYGGLDLGISKDISALALAFRLGAVEINGQIRPLIWLLMRYWVPAEGILTRWQEDGVDYPQWERAGWIKALPGRTTNNDIIRGDIIELGREYQIKRISADRAHAHELMTHLAEDDFEIHDHLQTLRAMTFPVRSFEDLVLEHRLRHQDDPVLKWMAGNAVVIQGGDNMIKVVKDKSPDRVDGITAAVMAIGQLLIAPADEENVYATRTMASA